MIKALFIATIVLVSLAAADPVADQPKLRGLGGSGGLLDVDVWVLIKPLLTVIAEVKLTDKLSIQACINALNLLKVYLKVWIGDKYTPCPPKPDCTIQELITIIVNVKLEVVSVCGCLDAIDVLCAKLIALCSRRNLGGSGGLLDIDLLVLIKPLLKVIAEVKLTDKLSIQACINALNLLKVYLKVWIGGNYTPCPPKPDCTIQDLITIIINVKLEIKSVCACLDAIDVLCAKLLALGHRDLGLIDLGGLLDIDLNLKILIAPLLKVVLNVDIGNKLSVQACIKALNLLKVYLKIHIGNKYIPCPPKPNCTIPQLLDIIVKVNLGNVLSVCAAIDAIDVLLVKLVVLV